MIAGRIGRFHLAHIGDDQYALDIELVTQEGRATCTATLWFDTDKLGEVSAALQSAWLTGR